MPPEKSPGTPAVPRSPSPEVLSGMQLVHGKINRKKVVSVLGPSGRIYSGQVCCCLAPASRIRLGFIWVVEQKWFDGTALTVIILNSIALAVQGPPDNPDAPITGIWAERMELAFTIAFTIEMVFKIMAMGFIWHRTRNKATCHAPRQLSRALPISSATRSAPG